MTTETDSELFQSFESVALPQLDDLFRGACSMLNSRVEAEDAVQETYLRAWKSFERFTPGTNCRAWLFRILFNVISHNRRKWLHRFRLQEPETFNQTPCEPPIPDRLTDEEVLEAFRKLPREYAEVVMLADVQEFTCKEIQAALAIPIGTVMSRLSRGRKLLRSHLSGFAPVKAARGATAGVELH